MALSIDQLRALEDQISAIVAEHLEPLLDGSGFALVIRSDDGDKHGAISLSNIAPVGLVMLLKHVSAKVAKDHPEALLAILSDTLKKLAKDEPDDSEGETKH